MDKIFLGIVGFISFLIVIWACSLEPQASECECTGVKSPVAETISYAFEEPTVPGSLIIDMSPISPDTGI